MDHLEETNYINTNKNLWNNRVDFHVKSEFYQVEAFLNGANSLNDIELNLLGDLKGKSVLHLQCHFGQDTLSLAKLGATVMGVDFSEKAINQAKEFATQLNINAEFICCNIYNLPQHLNKQFDIVFTSYGTIGWLPDLDKWARIVSSFLKPNGKFVFVEFHPVVWMFDNDFKNVGYNYFNTGAITETETGTYADRNAQIELSYYGWNHSLSEVFTSLLNQQLTINSFNEFDYSPYNCFSHAAEFEPKKYRIKHLENKIPMVYAIVATK